MNIHDTMMALSLIISSGAVGFVYRMSVKLEVLQTMFEDKKAQLSEVKTTQEQHEKRLSLVESAIVDLKEVLPELRKLGALAASVESFVQSANQRMTLLENYVFKP